MSTTLTYGRIRPATGDAASTWMAALEGNVTTDDSHTHNGSDSALLPISSLNKSANSTISSAGWTNDGGGNYSAVVTVPAAISGAATYNDILYYNVVCKINTAGATYADVVALQIERESATTFTVRSNEQLDIIIFYV